MLEIPQKLRGPYQISLDITNKCNLRCMHCYNYSGDNICINDELTDYELTKVVNDISKMDIFNICFCGGEPLLRKDILLKLIKILSSNHIGVSMVSNGTLLTEDVAKELKSVGIQRVQISLDGNCASHEKLRGLKGSYIKAINALENLKKFNIDTSIAFSPTVWNIDEFNDVFDLALKLDISELRVQSLMPIGRGHINKDFIIPCNAQYRKLMKYIAKCQYKAKKLSKNIDIQWGDPIDHLIRFPLNIKNNVHMTIKANGNIVPSIYLPLSLGNIRKHSIIEYWNSGMYKLWTLDIVKDVAKKYTSILDMDNTDSNIPVTFLEEDIYHDLIDDKLFESLSN